MKNDELRMINEGEGWQGTPPPQLVATARAEQYRRDAQATIDTYQLWLDNAYRHVEGTAQAATLQAELVAAQATATQQVALTRDALTFALTADAATAQAQTTAIAQTRVVAQETATAIVKQAEATQVARAMATQESFNATRQSLALAQARADAQRAQVWQGVVYVLLLFLVLLAVGLGVWFFWQLAPTLIDRAGVVQVGGQGPPLLLTQRAGRTVVTNPWRMMQASLTIDEGGQVVMPRLTPEQWQVLLMNHEPLRMNNVGKGVNGEAVRVIHPESQQESPTVKVLGAGGAPSWSGLLALAGQEGQGAVMGMGAEAPIRWDWRRTPHLFVAGMSGSGKTRRLLRPLIAQSLAQGFYVVLMNESGADFHPFYEQGQVSIVRGEVTDYLAVFEAAMGEMSQREQVLREVGVSEWHRLPVAYRQGRPFVLLAIDEVLSLVGMLTPKEQHRFWGVLSSFASRARKVGMYSVGLATDPTFRALGQGGLNYRSQCGRVSFRMMQASGSRAIFDANGAERLQEGEFMALLGQAGIQRGMAANPDDGVLQGYLARQAVAEVRLRWMEELRMKNEELIVNSEREKLRMEEGGKWRMDNGEWIMKEGERGELSMKNEQLIVNSEREKLRMDNGELRMKEEEGEGSPVGLPFDAKVVPTEAQVLYMRGLSAEGLSLNAICKQCYGFKDGRVYRYVKEALQDAQ